MKNNKSESRIKIFIDKIRKVWHFFTYGIWRITEHEVSGIKEHLVNIAKTIILTIRFFISDGLSKKASALTYNTLLAIVPVLALILAISKGFGFQDLLEQQLTQFFPRQEDIITKVFEFVTNYINQTKNGLFVGIGLVFLIWTIIGLIGNIELAFNHIWQIKRSRTYFRKFTDYLSTLLILPILMVVSSGLSIFITTSIKLPYFQFIFDPISVMIFRLAPYVITSILFTILFIIIPNTRVRFLNAFWAGIVSGIAFQIFQGFYIRGQIWVSKYNAIYGSFAALPLLLLWVQLSWLICLFGAELAYASQNIKNFSFEQDANNISRRYHDFVLILIATLIVKRFQNDLPPLNSEEISSLYKIPSKLTSQILQKLVDIGIVREVVNDNERIHAWQPAMDIHQISVGLVLDRLEKFGSENFEIDRTNEFSKEWEALIEASKAQRETTENILLMDLHD